MSEAPLTVRSMDTYNVLQWLPVVEEVASETQVCVYDRAEVGFPVKSTC
jgi:hypothetical protein